MHAIWDLLVRALFVTDGITIADEARRYHSHYSSQYGDGILGGILINGPATSNYDVDLGTMTVQDWYYQTAYQEALIALQGAPPTADNGLINGTMVNAAGGGQYLKTTITKGKRYRLRLINTSMDNHFKVHLDGHNLTVITSDFVPIVPYHADWLFIGIGQSISTFSGQVLTTTQANDMM